MRAPVVLILTATAAGTSAIAATGCDRTQAPSPAPNAASSSAGGGPVADTSAFRAELKAIGVYKKGEAATYEVVVTTKAPYHVNDEYPAKFRATDGNGVKHAEAKLERSKHVDAFATEPCAQGSKDACALRITVKFTPEQSGSVKLGGTVDVGVCNKDQCLVEKKQLDLAVPVT